MRDIKRLTWADYLTPRVKLVKGRYRIVVTVSDVSAYGSKQGKLLKECSWLIVITEEWKMKQTTVIR